MSLTEIVRSVNLFGGVVAVFWLLNRRVFSSRIYKDPLRSDIWFFGLSWSATVVVGTTEHLFHTGTSIGPLFATAALFFTFRILWLYDQDWFKTKKEVVGDEASYKRP